MPPLLHHAENGVVTLTLNRPARRNALTAELVGLLGSALAGASEDPDVRVIVLTGAGEAFCSGADLSAIFGVGEAERGALLADFQRLIEAIAEAPQPVIAVVDGAAAGFGADLALAADVRLLSTRAFFEWTFTKIGLLPDGGGTHFVPRYVGARAFEILALGERLEAAACLGLGMASRVAPPEELPEATREFVERLRSLAPLAVAEVKRALRASEADARKAALARERAGQLRLLGTRDFAEGVLAFREKRAPRFVGK